MTGQGDEGVANRHPICYANSNGTHAWNEGNQTNIQMTYSRTGWEGGLGGEVEENGSATERNSY